MPDIIDYLNFTLVLIVLGIALHRIRQHLLVTKSGLNRMMCFHYLVLIPAFVAEMLGLVLQSYYFHKNVQDDSETRQASALFVIDKSTANILNMFQQMTVCYIAYNLVNRTS